MKKSSADNLIKYIKENFKVNGTVFVSHQVSEHSHDSGIVHESFECSVFISSASIERMDANNFYNLTRLVIAKLTAMGLNK